MTLIIMCEAYEVPNSIGSVHSLNHWSFDLLTSDSSINQSHIQSIRREFPSYPVIMYFSQDYLSFAI